jgi:hypothetical protein
MLLAQKLQNFMPLKQEAENKEQLQTLERKLF